MVMKEIFMERISELLSNQSKNKMITNECYQNIIRKLKLLNEKPTGYQLQLESKNDYRLLKSHEILVVENDGVTNEMSDKTVQMCQRECKMQQPLPRWFTPHL